VLTTFVRQYIGRAGNAKLEIGHGSDDDKAGLDAISGATVTAIAENQVIAQSAYEIGKEVGIFQRAARPREGKRSGSSRSSQSVASPALPPQAGKVSEYAAGISLRLTTRKRLNCRFQNGGLRACFWLFD